MIYVCSDIHGKYDYFMDILNKINFNENDFMYILGDVIDRGEEPIKVLKYITEQDNMTLLIGNHEHMMLRSLLHKDNSQFFVWMQNGGGVTLDQFNQLEKREQDSLIVYLLRCPIVIPQIKVNNKYYYLAHASHLDRYEEDPLIYANCNQDEINHVVWSRDYSEPFGLMLNNRYGELYNQYKDTTLIIGHTPVFYTNYKKIEKGMPKISRGCKGHLINVDCGCAANLPLACLRLDDGKEFYADLEEGIKVI